MIPMQFASVGDRARFVVDMLLPMLEDPLATEVAGLARVTLRDRLLQKFIYERDTNGLLDLLTYEDDWLGPVPDSIIATVKSLSLADGEPSPEFTTDKDAALFRMLDVFADHLDLQVRANSSLMEFLMTHMGPEELQRINELADKYVHPGWPDMKCFIRKFECNDDEDVKALKHYEQLESLQEAFFSLLPIFNSCQLQNPDFREAVYVASNGDVVCGSMAVTFSFDDRSVYVDLLSTQRELNPNIRGVGRQLMERLIADCRASNVSFISLKPVQGKEDFYRLFGFEFMGEKMYLAIDGPLPSPRK